MTVYELFSDPDTPWVEASQKLLALLLFAGERTIQEFCADLLVDLLGDGRVGGQELADSLYHFSRDGNAVCKRLERSLKPVLEISHLHKQIVKDALAELICRPFEKLPRDFHFILNLYQELLLESGDCVPAAAVEFLQSFSGSNKSAKLAKSLLKTTKEESTSKQFTLTAAAQSLEWRLQRAERWQAWLEAE